MDIRSRWNEVKACLKQRYEMLSDDDLMFNPGRESDLMIRLQNKLGKTKADIIKILGEV